jgi:DNA polymerase-4
MGMPWLLHLDMDQFIVAVEVLRRPELRGRPVVVGGDGNPRRPRQVVASASYEARAFGVRSGMPLSAALRRCPDAVFLPTDHAAYDAASATVMNTLRRFPVRVEVWGWDEAYFGGDIADPHALAAEVRAAVLASSGLSASIGIGHNKHQAKIAAQFAKPGGTTQSGVFEITAANWMQLMGARPVSALFGVGPKTAKKLDALGLHTVADLAAADPAVLLPVFGPRMAPWLPILANGGGDTELFTEPWVARSRSREETFDTDVADPAQVASRLDGMTRELARDVVADGRRVTHVAVKVRYRSFFTPIRSMKLRGGPTTDLDVIAAAASTVLAKIDLDRPVRLLGVRLDLEPLTATGHPPGSSRPS